MRASRSKLSSTGTSGLSGDAAAWRHINHQHPQSRKMMPRCISGLLFFVCHSDFEWPVSYIEFLSLKSTFDTNGFVNQKQKMCPFNP